MTPAQLRKAIAKRPFIPFEIRTTAGERYRVGHPEAIWQAQPPEETTLILQDREAGVVFTDTSCVAEVVFSRGAKKQDAESAGP